MLTVAWLGAGSAWLQIPARARDVLLGALGVASLAATAAVLLAPVDVALLAAATSGRPPANGALEGHAFLWAVALNTVGTLFLIGGSLWSIARRRRVGQNLWIGSGAAFVALSTGLTRSGDTSFVYLGELIGIVPCSPVSGSPTPRLPGLRRGSPLPRSAAAVIVQTRSAHRSPIE